MQIDDFVLTQSRELQKAGAEHDAKMRQMESALTNDLVARKRPFWLIEDVWKSPTLQRNSPKQLVPHIAHSYYAGKITKLQHEDASAAHRLTEVHASA